MAAGWNANSLVPGLAGLRAGGATRGTLSGLPLNTTSNLIAPASQTGIPPFIQGALNPFLSAVSDLQNRWRGTAVSPVGGTTVMIQNPADQIRAQVMQAQQQAAQNAARAAQEQISRTQTQLGNLPTGFGGISPMGMGAERAALQQRLLGLEGQLNRAQSASFGTPISPMGGAGWANTFSMPVY